MRLFRGQSNCPTCQYKKGTRHNHAAYNGRGAMVDGLYLTNSKNYACTYGVLHTLDFPFGDKRFKILKCQYFGTLETLYFDFKWGKANKEKAFTKHLVSLGYDFISIRKGHEVIAISGKAKQYVADNLRLYDWN